MSEELKNSPVENFDWDALKKAKCMVIRAMMNW